MKNGIFMVDKALSGLINFILGISLNVSFGNFIELANPVVSFMANIAGLAFTVIGIFYIYQAFKHKREQRKKLEYERRTKRSNGEEKQ